VRDDILSSRAGAKSYISGNTGIDLTGFHGTDILQAVLGRFRREQFKR